MKLKQLKNQGFTIIEVLIVLAIAGLILLVVFLAVPALQRNNRNQQYRSEASRMLGATNEFINNNGGTSPTASISNVSAPNDASKIFTLGNAKNFTVLTVAAQGTAYTPSLTSVQLNLSSKCASASSAGTGSTRQVALLYSIEDSTGAAQPQCLDS